MFNIILRVTEPSGETLTYQPDTLAELGELISAYHNFKDVTELILTNTEKQEHFTIKTNNPTSK